MVLESVNLQAWLRSLESTGFYDVALPFLLIFTIVFAVLQKVELFGTRKSKNYNLIISLVMAFLVIRMTPIVTNINMFLPKVSWIVLVLIMTLMLLGIFGAKAEGFTGVPFFVAILISIGGIIWALSPSARLPSWLQLTTADKVTLFAIGAFFLAIYFVFREGSNDSSNKEGRWKWVDELPGHFGKEKKP